MLDLTAVRSRFPALASGAAFFDGPGGSQVPAAVIDAMAGYLRDLEREPGRRVPRPRARRTRSSERGARSRRRLHRRRAGGDRVRGEHDDAQLPARARGRAHARAGRRDRGHRRSTTTRTSRPGCWWPPTTTSWSAQAPLRAEDVTLDHDALEGLLGERTRVVAFTLASNAVGSITDAAPHRRGRARRRRARLGGRRPPRAAPPPAPRRARARRAALLALQVLRPAPGHRGDPARPRRVAARRPRAAGRRGARRGTASRPAPSRTRRSPGAWRRSSTCARSATATSTRPSRGSSSTRTQLSRRFLERPAAIGRRRSTASATRPRAARRPSASTSTAARRERWPSCWPSATSTCGTATTTRSRRCARSGWRSSGGAVRAGFLHYTTEDEVDRLLEALADLTA